MPLVADCMKNNLLCINAPAAISRNTLLPEVREDVNGFVPFCVASRNPNGVFSVATLGRTVGRKYFIPKCDVTLCISDADTVGVFGEYKNLILETDRKEFKQILMQDLADDMASDVTDSVLVRENRIIIPGELISKVGTMAQPETDTSEPGIVISLN